MTLTAINATRITGPHTALTFTVVISKKRRFGIFREHSLPLCVCVSVPVSLSLSPFLSLSQSLSLSLPLSLCHSASVFPLC